MACNLPLYRDRLSLKHLSDKKGGDASMLKLVDTLRRENAGKVNQ